MRIISSIRSDGHSVWWWWLLSIFSHSHLFYWNWMILVSINWYKYYCKRYLFSSVISSDVIIICDNRVTWCDMEWLIDTSSGTFSNFTSFFRFQTRISSGPYLIIWFLWSKKVLFSRKEFLQITLFMERKKGVSKKEWVRKTILILPKCLFLSLLLFF